MRRPVSLWVLAFLSIVIDKIGSKVSGKITNDLGGKCLNDVVIGKINDPMPSDRADTARIVQNVAKCITDALKDGGVAGLAEAGLSVGELDDAFNALKAVSAVGLGAEIGNAGTVFVDYFVGVLAPDHPVSEPALRRTGTRSCDDAGTRTAGPQLQRHPQRHRRRHRRRRLLRRLRRSMLASTGRVQPWQVRLAGLVGTDPATCNFYMDGSNVFSAQCGVSPSKTIDIAPGRHVFQLEVCNRLGACTRSGEVARERASLTPVAPSATTYRATVGVITNTWTNHTNAGGTAGQRIPAGTTVQVACRLQGFAVKNGNTWWYRIASSPWSSSFYASADAFSQH